MTSSRVTSRQQQARLMRMASIYAIAAAVGLVTLKLVVWQKTGSLSMLSTLIDSLLDVGMSMVNFFAVRAALIPADSEHRFGHGKAEALAALSQAIFIALSSILLVIEAARRFHRPEPVSHEWLAILAMIVSIALTYSLVMFQTYVVTRTGSLAIASDRVHYKTDTVINFSVLIAMLVIALTGYLWVDALVAALVAIYLVWCSRSIFLQAFDVLLDRELPDQVKNEIIDIILAEKEMVDFHDLRTRMAGPNYFIQFHLELDSHLTLIEAHEITDRIECAIMDRFPQAQVSIHQEPAGIDDARDNFA